MEFPFEYIDDKYQTIGENLNFLQMYAFDGILNEEALIAFCREKKQQQAHVFFYLLVLFDKKECAVFPDDPFTALYSGDPTMKHIRAMYRYLTVNQHSQLTIYETDAFTSKVLVELTI